MKKIDEIDDHMLGTFVDGQLDAATSQFILKAMENDATIRERVYQIRRAKDLMKLGFAGARPPTTPRSNTDFEKWKPGAYGLLASLLILITGIAVGILGYHSGKQLGYASVQVHPAAEQPLQERLILHISQSEPRQFAKVLAYTKDFLQQHQAQGDQIAVIANAAGLDLLRQDVSPYQTHIDTLIREYKNVHFIACASAIRGLREQGIEPLFHKDVDTSTPAFDQILTRIQQGWTYIKAESLLEI